MHFVYICTADVTLCANYDKIFVTTLILVSAVNLKGIWPRRELKAWAVQHSCGGGSGALFCKFSRGSCPGCLNAIYGPAGHDGDVRLPE